MNRDFKYFFRLSQGLCRLLKSDSAIKRQRCSGGGMVSDRNEDLNGVPLKSVISKILAKKSVISKTQGQKSSISKILPC